MRTINEIIVHCTATPEGRNVTVKEVDKWHRDKGWNAIGYHYLIYLDGSIHKGRPVERQGAHCSTGGHRSAQRDACQSKNRHSIGVCYVGGCSKDGKAVMDTRTPEQKTALASFLTELHNEFPHATLHGHREFVCSRVQKGICKGCVDCKFNKPICLLAAKACPSFDVHEYDYIFK